MIERQYNGYWYCIEHEANKQIEIFLRGRIRAPGGSVLDDKTLVEDLWCHGQAVLDYWEGDYFIAFNDKQRMESWCACGPIGCESAYVVQKDGKMVVGSDPLEVAKHTGKYIDKTGLFMFLNSGYMWDERTLIDGMRILPPATICLADGRFKKGPDLEKDDAITGFESCEEFLEDLDKELGLLANEHDRLLVQLSGGVDSRLIAVRCRTLGIPFETVTQVAEVYKDDDFEIAVRVAKSLGVRHHKWHWDASGFLQSTDKLILGSGGVNDAYTSYPDGIAELSRLAEGFGGIVRGDETFGWGFTAKSPSHAAEQVNVDLEDKLDGYLIQPQAGVPELLGQVTGWRENFSPDESDVWKNAFYRQVRLPRLIMPVARWQQLAGTIEFPFLACSIVKRFARTELALRSDKRLVREALSMASPNEIRTIPFAARRIWRYGEPLLSIRGSDIRSMTAYLRDKKNVEVRELVDVENIVQKFSRYRRTRQFRRGVRPIKVWADRYYSAAKRRISRKSVAASQRPSLIRPCQLFKRIYAVSRFVRALG